MLRFGIVSNIDEKTAKVRVQFAQDNLLSYWLPVLQAKTLNDKFYCIPDIGEQVACLMDEKAEFGVVVGAIYSNLDTVPVVSKDKFKIKFQDNSEFEYDRILNTLNIISKNIKIKGNINHDGVFTNTQGINSASDVTDHTSSIQAIRDKYNPHTHTGNQGSPTSAPNEVM